MIIDICIVLIYSNQDGNSKRCKARKYYLLKGNIKNYNIINGKTFYDQPIDSDIKRYKEMRKLTTGQSEDYAGFLLDYEYTKTIID